MRFTTPSPSSRFNRAPSAPPSPSRLCAFDSRPAAGARTRTAYAGGPQASSSSTEAGRRPAHRRPITIAAMRKEPGAAGQAADPAVAWIKEWRRLIPPPGVWWRKSAFDLASARRANRLRPWRWLTEPVATFRIWLATGRLSPAERARWNRRAEAAAGADRLLSALDPYQRRAAVCFEDRAMVTAGAGSGKTRTMVARAGYAARRLRTPPKAIAFITFTNKATEEIRQRTRERLPGLQVGTIHQLARRVLKLVHGRTVPLSPMAEDEGLRLRPIAGWIREEIVRDPGLAADVELRRNARSAAVKDGEPVERHRIPPDGREVEVARRGCDWNPAAHRRRALRLRSVVPAPGREGRGRGRGRRPAGGPEGLPARLLPAGRPESAGDGGGRRLARALRARPERLRAGRVCRLRGGARLEAASAREPFDTLCRDLLRGPAARLGRRRTGHGGGARRTAAGGGRQDRRSEVLDGRSGRRCRRRARPADAGGRRLDRRGAPPAGRAPAAHGTR